MFVDYQGKGYQIGRVVGGLAWPSEKPGFVVAIAEELYPRVGNALYQGKYHYHLLGEAEDFDLGKLLDRCSEFAESFNIQDFYTRTHYGPNMRFWGTWRDQQRGRSFDLSFSPHCQQDGQITWHVNNLLNLAGQGVLHLSEGPLTEARLKEIQSEEISAATDSQFPAIAAVCYAVAELTEHPPGFFEEIDESQWDDEKVDPVTGY